MALIEISETQLAFGYLHSYLNVHGHQRFVLPSIRQEGGNARFRYPGADIIISDNHLIQFKRPIFLLTAGISEFRNYDQPADFGAPYFRIHIKNNDPTNQLNSLIRATQNGLSAEYISPLFTDDNAFFALIGNDNLHLQSYAHIDIAQFDGMGIGNDNDHTILYTEDSVNNGYCYCFSEPKKLKAAKVDRRQGSNSNEQIFNPLKIIQIISSIYFQDRSVEVYTRNLLYQCMILQQKLFIEKNIVWLFKYSKKK